LKSGTQSSSFCGNANPGGITPTIVAGIPLIRLTADRVVAAAEVPLPHAVAQNGHFRRAGAVVRGGKVAAAHGRDAQNPEEVVGHVRAGVAARVPVHRDVDRRSAEVRGRALEGLIRVPDVFVVLGGDLRPDAERVRRRGVDEIDRDQPIGVRKRESPQHHRVDDAEHRRHAADAEREHRDRERGEAAFLDEHASRCGCPDPSGR
jgi:hypothetical protein